MKSILKLLFSRMFIVGFLILIQVMILIIAIWKLSEYFIYLYGVLTLISIFAVLWIINKNDNPSYKLAWTIPILLFPVFGGLFYLLFGSHKTTDKLQKKMEDIHLKILMLLPDDSSITDELQSLDKNVYNQSKYISDWSCFPVYKKTATFYFSSGEEKFQRLLDELRKAEHYIFMEYFIIEEGLMWNSILDILKEKVGQGLDVRILYDDFGCIRKLPYKYNEYLESIGIKCIVFNPFRPELSGSMNHRDHRKITIIDGHTGFTGGVNLADEYINEVERFGHWKDAAIMIQGEAVWNLTIMFLEVWEFECLKYAPELKTNYENFRPDIYEKNGFENDGFVQPYGDSPIDNEIVGELIYLNIINKAKNYVYIATPYLIVDNEMITALTLAAKNGVDVRIITPFKWDKFFVHMVTQAYYPPLIEAGVRIYEYTPGFIHSKIFIADGEIATVGTINLDYRSLFLHFECGVWMYKSKAVQQAYEDYMQTLKVSHEITLEECAKVKWYRRLLRGILRIFAPLM